MKTVVLVDDEYYFRQAMKQYIAAWPEEYRVAGESKSGKEGLALICREQPDIILMDINMPGMNGLELAGELERIFPEDRTHRKIILLTGYDEFEYARKAVRLGVFDYLLKPIDKDQLKNCLDQASRKIDGERKQQESMRIQELSRSGSFFRDNGARLVLYMRTGDLPGMESLVRNAFMEMKREQADGDFVLRRAGDMISCAFDASWEGENGGEEMPTLPDLSGKDADAVQEEVLRFIAERMRFLEEKRQSRKTDLPEKVMRYIGENYSCFNLTLQEMSKHFGVSKTVLCQQFRDAAGMTIGEYILQVRMLRARELFEKGCGNVAYAAEKCGYEDAGYFSKCFKKYFGISPKSYFDARS